MAFGQQSGPPASRRQIEELEALLGRAGFTSFREARHPYGLTQRQAAGKFSVAEADELIERLSAAELVQSSATSDGADSEAIDPEPVARKAPVRTPAAGQAGGARLRTLRELSDDVIVAELERRGWCCIPPLGDR